MKKLHESKGDGSPQQDAEFPWGDGGALTEARKRLPLHRLMAAFGHACPQGGRAGFICPFCGKKKASLREHKARLWFKCFNTACPSGTSARHGAFDEVAFTGFKLGLSPANGRAGRYSDAAIAFMKEAGVWQEKAGEAGKSGCGSLPRSNLRPSTNGNVSLGEVSPPVAVSQEFSISGPHISANDEPLATLLEDLKLSESPDFMEKRGSEALCKFFEHLTCSQADERILFEKRGLTSVTVAALRFRSNPRSNQQVIEQMAGSLGWPEMIASGLALAADSQRDLGERPNMQFCGMGQAGKIPKAVRKHPNDKVKWGWTLPVLIPSFEASGKLAALRPHKGGAPAGTAAGGKSLYIPRAFEPPFAGPEQFATVVVTEGEFKAAALWQTVGVGAQQFRDANKLLLFNDPAFGVCALPGISYVKHVETRAVLEDWLRMVNGRQVIVAFDHEEKGDPDRQSYEEDPERRYASLIYAFYLAADLAQKLQLCGRVCVLPKAWMNAAGKVDWDGALAALVHQGKR